MKNREVVQEEACSTQQERELSLREEIAREVGQHAENCPWEDCSRSEQNAAHRSAKFIISKVIQHIKGMAGLSDAELLEILSLMSIHCHKKGEDFDLAVSRKIAQASKQNIIDNLEKEK